jgi:FSR family fosmidomycin resistance protein-like MFS transporter
MTTLPRKPLFWSVCVGHTMVDLFSTIGPVLLAFMAVHVLPMTNTQIGFAVSVFSLMGALSQPFFGAWADRTGGRWLGAGGVAWLVAFVALAMLVATTTGSYTLMLIPYVIAALGSGALHPVGTMHAAAADSQRVGRNLSIFFLMGQLGSSIGPVVIGAILDRFASNNAAFTAGFGAQWQGRLLESGTVLPAMAVGLVALPIVVWMLFSLPTAAAFARHERGAAPSRRDLAVKALLLLAAMVALRSLANPGMVAFIPRLFQVKGWTAAEYGAITSLYWLASGLAGVWFGSLADRFGARNVIALTLLIGAPMVFFLSIADGGIALVLALLAGALTGGSHSLIVATTQRLMPTGKGLASGAALGFIFGMGAVATLVIGALADAFGLVAAFQIVAAVTVGASALAWFLPDERRVPHALAHTVQQRAEPASEAVPGR